MTQIRIKRVYKPVSEQDGYRVLIDKFWPRGMRKEAFHYDLWMKSLAPTDELRRWFHVDPEGRWEEFRRRYTEQLARSPEVAAFVSQIVRKQVLTLLFAAKDPARNHALVLQAYLQRIAAG